MKFLTYYGDDFTGSTDVMEALALHGIATILFTRIPTVDEFAQFSSFDAIGLAGTSRSQTPDWMDEHLPVALSWLKAINSRFCHYKVCSTFDSSPGTGNIGRASEIGARLFEQAMVPLVVGVPQLRRYTFGANLFAAFQGSIYRIDRHPVMARHPVTPMRESDLRRHLALQTSIPTHLVEQSFPSAGLALLDVYDDESQLVAGQRLLELEGGFLVGSSGIEYALLKALAARGSITGRAGFAPLGSVRQTIAVSGSVSPTTERQIRFALNHGFESVPVAALELARPERSEAMRRAVAHSLEVLARGHSPLVHTALGHATDDGARLDHIVDSRKLIGEGLGEILKQVVKERGLRRAIVAGGDSSSHALGQLDIFALTTRMPLPATPGSPLCTAVSRDSQLNGIEIALKGGQVGRDDYFVAIRDGLT